MRLIRRILGIEPEIILVREPGLTEQRLTQLIASWQKRGQTRLSGSSPMQEGFGYGLLAAAEELKNALILEGHITEKRSE